MAPNVRFVKDTDSLAEMLQRALPGVNVVKTLNTIVAAIMVKPSLVEDGDITVFLSGNSSQAKSQAAGLLGEMGWVDILDLGDISTARGVEMLSILGHTLFRSLNTEYVTVKIVR